MYTVASFQALPLPLTYTVRSFSPSPNLLGPVPGRRPPHHIPTGSPIATDYPCRPGPPFATYKPGLRSPQITPVPDPSGPSALDILPDHAHTTYLPIMHIYFFLPSPSPSTTYYPTMHTYYYWQLRSQGSRPCAHTITRPCTHKIIIRTVTRPCSTIARPSLVLSLTHTNTRPCTHLSQSTYNHPDHAHIRTLPHTITTDRIYYHS